MAKTNAMRLLDRDQIPYELFEYEVDENDLSGVHTAGVLGIEFDVMFKTLVLRSEKKEFLVCCIPVHQELDLKKVAKASHHKSVEMLSMKELLPTTGYIRGGCSPIGMKKTFPVYIDETVILWDEVYISAGARGVMLKLKSEDLLAYVKAETADLCKM